ncbi:MAG: LexA family transcriptional regulator [Solibacillus sp.]
MKKGEKYEFLMKNKEMTFADVARETGIPYTTIKSMIERDFKKASVDNVIAVAKAIDASIEDFIPEAAPIAENNHYEYDFDKIDTQAIMVKESREIYHTSTDKMSLRSLNYAGQISAGSPMSVECITDGEKIDIPKTILGKYAERDGVHIRKVLGDSMDKLMPSGSYVVCVPIEKHELQNDDIVIFSYNNESGMKRYKVDGERQIVIFKAESNNDKYYDLVIPFDTTSEVVIHAKVVLGVLSFI